MLDQPAAPRSDAERRHEALRLSDHAMDALQYGLAILAIVVAVLLAAIR